MFQNNRSFDFGLRGAPAPRPRFDSDPAGRYDADMERRADPDARLSNRVTAPYTYNYVYGNRGPRYPRNFDAYTGGRANRTDNPDTDHRRCAADEGTRTSRAERRLSGYDAAVYSSGHQSRSPDEV